MVVCSTPPDCAFVTDTLVQYVVEKGAKEKSKEMKLVFSGDIKKLKKDHAA
jgi:hypothetical protein